MFGKNGLSNNRLRMAQPLAAAAVLAMITSLALAGDWTRFRGPNGAGVSDSNVPTNFSAMENMKWKAKMPGPGYSSPILVGDKVFVTCYSGYGVNDEDPGNIEELKRHLICVDRKSGDIVWNKAVAAVQPEDPFTPPGVSTHGYASHTPVSDGELVYAFFGKSGVVAFDLDGNQKWQTSVGTESAPMRWGSAASPVVHEGLVIVNAADESQTLVALDAKTGVEKWKQPASSLDNCWATPIFVETDAGAELVLGVMGEIWGLNPTTGKLRWYAKGNEDRTIGHSVVAADGVVYGIGDSAIAVRAGGKGDVIDSSLVWEQRAGNRFATPLLHGGRLYYMARGGVVNCIDASDGKRIFRGRLSSGEAVADEEVADAGRGGGGRGGRGGGPPGGGRGGGRGNFGRGIDFASPVLAGENIYVAMQSGTVYVVAATSKFEVLAKNDLGDSSGMGATPAIGDGELFIRSNTHLYCIAED